MTRHIVLVAVAALTVACESAIGLPDDVNVRAAPLDAGAEAEATVECAPSTETNKCFKCTDEACCKEYAACQADGRCAQYYKDCLPKCQSAGKTYFECVIECDAKHGAGHEVFAPYHACSEANCLTECSGSVDKDACKACAYASCREASRACTADRQCQVLEACIGVCDGKPSYEDCAKQCRAEASEHAADLFNRKMTCMLQYCPNACSVLRE